MRIQDRSTLEAFLSENGLSSRHITVAFSGGADSLALLILLSSVTDKLDAIYVNHNLRGEAELASELKLNTSNAERLEVPFKVVTLPAGCVEEYASSHGITLEAAARVLRYEALEAEAPDLIATAHTSDDQTETLMMRLLSGCTVAALAGVRQVRGNIIRPVLDFSRQDTERICNEAGLTWAEDSTNSTLFCQRNRVRHLVTLSAEARSSLLSISRNVQYFLDRIPPLGLCRHKTCYTFEREKLLSAHPLAISALVYEIYSLFTDKLVSRGEVDEVVKAVREGSSLDNRFFHLRCSGGEARVYPRFPFFAAPFEPDTSLPHSLSLKFSEEKSALRIDSSLICGKAVLRLAAAEDEIQLKDHSVRVGELLAQYHLPYAIVMEDAYGLVAFFGAVFGGRDRLSARFLTQNVPKTGVSIS